MRKEATTTVDDLGSVYLSFDDICVSETRRRHNQHNQPAQNHCKATKFFFSPHILFSSIPFSFLCVMPVLLVFPPLARSVHRAGKENEV